MMEASKRITPAVLSSALAKKLDIDENDIVVDTFQVSKGCNEGESKMCLITAATGMARVKNELQTFDFIVKLSPANPFGEGIILQCGIFGLEVSMYEKVLPKLRLIEDQYQLEPRLGVPLTLYSDAHKGVLILENLKSLGYALVPKDVGLSMSHLKLALEQLACLHASSYHFIKTYDGGLEKFKTDFKDFLKDFWSNTDTDAFSASLDMMGAAFDQLFVKVAEEHCTGDLMHLVDKMKHFARVRKEICAQALRVKEDRFNCIVHGDSWRTNFLFKDDQEGNPIQASLLDFQLTRRGSPAQDLAYLMAACTTPAFRQKHLEELLSFYHRVLTQRLLKLGHKDVYSFQALEEDFESYAPFMFVMGRIHFWINNIPDDHEEAAFTVEKLLSDGDRVMKAMSKYLSDHQDVKDKVISLLLEADQQGLLKF